MLAPDARRFWRPRTERDESMSGTDNKIIPFPRAPRRPLGAPPHAELLAIRDEMVGLVARLAIVLATLIERSRPPG